MNPGEGASTRKAASPAAISGWGASSQSRKSGEARANAIEAEGIAARKWTCDLIASENLDCNFRLVGRFVGAMGAGQ